MLQAILCWIGIHPTWRKPVYIDGKLAYHRCLHCFRKTDMRTKASRLRWTIRADMPAIMRIEGMTETGFSEEIITAMLKKRNIIGHVLEDEYGDVVAHALISIEKKEYVIEHFAGYDEHLGELLHLLKEKAGKHKPRIAMYAGEENLELHLLLRDNGYHCEGIDADIGEDEVAYVFVYPPPGRKHARN